MNNQRLRNLTTGRLHTNIGDIYEDVEYIVGEKGIMTHHLPMAFRAMQPWLKARVTESRFWDGKYDPTHDGETELPQMTSDEKAFFWKRYREQPSPLMERLAKNPDSIIVVETK